MAVLVNFKICDNAKECGGVTVCPTGALSYDDKKNTIVIDNEKCISCGRCEKECPIGAIMVAKNEEEYHKIKKAIDEDKRTIKDLFVDRYGATPLSEFFMIEADELEEKVHNDSITLIELYNDDSIQCLLKSIPIKDLTKNLPKDTLFYKINSNDVMLEQFEVQKLPTLLVFEKGHFKGQIDGYFTNDEKETLLNKLNAILK
jgi:Fe-S-cluster-containing dehydrogenase component